MTVAAVEPEELPAYLDPPGVVLELVRRARERLDADLRLSDGDWIRIDDALDAAIAELPR